jgi:septum formation protein
LKRSGASRLPREGGSDLLILASGSARRAALLRQAGIPFEQGSPPGVDETPPRGATAREVALTLAERKAVAAMAREPGRRVLTADTLVALGDSLVGKPADEEDAVRILTRLAGREHRIFTGVAVGRDGRLFSNAAGARVRVDSLSSAQIRAYVATGEPLGKAGAYALQGRAAAFVRLVEGAPDTVIGLPLDVVHRLLAALGPARG